MTPTTPQVIPIHFLKFAQLFQHFNEVIGIIYFAKTPRATYIQALERPNREKSRFGKRL